MVKTLPVPAPRHSSAARIAAARADSRVGPSARRDPPGELSAFLRRAKSHASVCCCRSVASSSASWKTWARPSFPVCLDGVWGSIFSYQRGRFFWKVPRCLPYPVTISFGKALPPSATAFGVRSVIQELTATDAWSHRRRTMKPLHRAFVQRARRCPLRFAMADARVPRLSFGGALMKVIFLARRLRSRWAGQEMVGILLPPSVAGALVNFAALLMGKVP